MYNSSQQTSSALDPPPAMDVDWLKSQNPAKTSWPEVVGMTAAEAEKKIKEELHGAYTPVLRLGDLITFDLRKERVRLFVDDVGKVAETPFIG